MKTREEVLQDLAELIQIRKRAQPSTVSLILAAIVVWYIITLFRATA